MKHNAMVCPLLLFMSCHLQNTHPVTGWFSFKTSNSTLGRRTRWRSSTLSRRPTRNMLWPLRLTQCLGKKTWKTQVCDMCMIFKHSCCLARPKDRKFVQWNKDGKQVVAPCLKTNLFVVGLNRETILQGSWRWYCPPLWRAETILDATCGRQTS